MGKTALLATAAVFALTMGASSAAELPAIGVTGVRVSPIIHKAKGAKMLYNQNSDSIGDSLDSQNFSSSFSKTYNSAGADDFVVPKNQTWTVTEVDVTGVFYQGSGPATSENVTFYADAESLPGKAVKGGSFSDLNGTNNAGSYSIPLGKKGITLKSGTYWVSVVANCGYSTGCGEWGWSINSRVHNNPAVWENPGNGFGSGCTSWGTIATCEDGSYSGDFMFDLQGKAKK